MVRNLSNGSALVDLNKFGVYLEIERFLDGGRGMCREMWRWRCMDKWIRLNGNLPREYIWPDIYTYTYK